MPSRRQKRVAEKIVETAHLSNPPTGGEIVESSGYGPSMKKNPQVVLNSQGVKDALNDLGFSEDNAKKVVAKILLNEESKDHDRLDAADKVFKIHGSYAPEKQMNLNLNVERSEDIKALTERLNALYRETSKRGNGMVADVMDDKASDKERGRKAD